MQHYNINELFKANTCTFEMAKVVKDVGMTCTNTYFAYDDKGEVTDGGWLDELGLQNQFYPCINLAFALHMLEDTGLYPEKIELWSLDSNEHPTQTVFYFKYCDDPALESTNQVDLLLLVWMKYKK